MPLIRRSELMPVRFLHLNVEVVGSHLQIGKREIPVGRGPEMGLFDLLRSDPERVRDLMAAQGKVIATAPALP